MKPKNKPKYYAFLDITVDVFYSIILYNAFVQFPGFTLEALLMLLSVFIMLNYWWTARTYESLPKHYLFDFYFIPIIMFIFSQWPSYYNNVYIFTIVLAIFFAVDSLYALLSIYAHKEKADESSLKTYFLMEMILAVVYLVLSQFITSLSIEGLLALCIPYLIAYVFVLKKGLMKTRFLYSKNLAD